LTKPKDSFWTPINDLLPRVGLVQEGRLQIFIFALNALADELLLRTILKRNNRKESWLKSTFRSGLSFCARISWALAATSAFYYREPEQTLLGRDAEFFYAPADGKVVAIEQVEELNFIQGQALRITLAIGPLALHILRAPCAGRIEYIFVEQNAKDWTKYIGLRDSQGRKFLLGQVTSQRQGWKLLRLLGSPGPHSTILTAGQQIQQNDKIGVAAWGWRTQVTLTIPVETKFELLLRQGQPTQAAMTVLGRVV